MGLDCAAVKFLCGAKSMGVDFAHTIMVGRQAFYPKRDTLERVSAVLGISCDPIALLNTTKFGESFFTLLGAKQVSSLDASAYEGATYVHDLNLALPVALSQRFSALYDGGTLEHVFNFPLALKNCMEMVHIGGHFIQGSVANNFMGHGFWQLSPELIYRVFAPENGYRIEAVLLHEVVPGGAWYAVQNPDEARQRVELCNKVPTYIFSVARRVALTEIFAKAPQQSDYVAGWAGRGWEAPAPKPVGSRRMIPSGLRQLVPQPVKYLLSRMLKRPPSPYDATFYRRIEEDDLLRGRMPCFT
jgi:hypothetical protein